MTIKTALTPEKGVLLFLDGKRKDAFAVWWFDEGVENGMKFRLGLEFAKNS
ncbi:MAG: hypothetical protein G01um101420_787 [Parcubacteria group bacterium Gr01-1014_20]|nr:MAG: hypothetical protein G01um101420_787 [Parcubacteria group bacterium Gr01-1014_20]